VAHPKNHRIAGRLPNLFLCAAPRSGSTQLAAWLNSHPAIEIGRVKEPNYFSRHDFPEEYVRQERLDDAEPARIVRSRSKTANFAVFRSVDDYRKIYDHLSAQYLLDASTSYLHSGEAAREISRCSPEAKVIILTRDPVDRTLSSYRLAVRMGKVRSSLQKELEKELDPSTPEYRHYLFRQSLYEDAIARFYDHIDCSRILQLSFEDLYGVGRGDEIVRVGKFLDVCPKFFDLDSRNRNAGSTPRYPAVNSLTQRTGIKQLAKRHMPPVVRRIAKRYMFESHGAGFGSANLCISRDSVLKQLDMYSTCYRVR